MARLEVRNLKKRFGCVSAIEDVSFELEAGKVLGISGPSGSGKTTLLRVIAGLEVPDSGSVTVDGRVLSGEGVFVKPHARPVGMMFHESALWPHMRILKNLTFVMKDGGRMEKRKRARELLDRLSVGELAERYPHELSEGQKRRAAFARIMAAAPAVVLLDEPFAGLDEKLRVTLGGEIRRMAGAGATVIFVSHLEKESLDYCEASAIIKEGKLDVLRC